MTDQLHMQRALDLAEASIGMASPNPQVGCVLVRDGNVLGEGAHDYDARDHAEIVALKQAAAQGNSTQGAAAYVTLEPCSHHGRTGPCADALIAAGITRCFVATVDPNPAVAGSGIARLRAVGVEVSVGLEHARARRLNEPFAESIQRQRPFIHLKSALSVDGRLAPLDRTPGTPHWLTGPESRVEVHRLRHASDAILTGIGTVLADDPLLTDRSGLPRRRPLLRIVLDSQLRLPLNSKLLNEVDHDVWIVCAEAADRQSQDKLEARGARVFRIAHDNLGLQLSLLMEHLHQAHILGVLLEGGSRINSQFLHRHLVDRVTFFYAPIELGPGSIPFAKEGPTSFALEERMTAVSKRALGPDVCVSGLLNDPWPAN